MGRHRRATPAPSEPLVHTPEGGRHRGTHRKRSAAPVRTGLLGASAAVAMGAVAVASGLIPGPGGGYTVGDSRDPGERVRADGPSDLATQGSPSEPAPSATGSGTPGDDAKRDRSPSAKPTKSPEEDKSSAKPTPSPEKSRPGGGSSGDDKSGDGGTTPEKPSTPRDDKPSGGSGEEAAAEAQVLKLVNQERAQKGCEPVRADAKLAEFAGDYSVDMAVRGFFSHNTPDGKSPWDRAKSAGILNLGGENIARGQANAQSVMDSWMDSPGHRANILNCDYRTMGVGAHFAEGGPWWTQNFGF
ncbi:CAP domain-containing protein [Streptomyces armeniacus]|uniref:CAP domain-containing protein n=1 Tax=Streptomyces armeniacus TaxID=83291 RepID=A0A345XNI4_9ACTN|nr:CAP domain-containing protein [Streptomyces armeniacus]AXK33200.1 CAP domain-containing protein [Streptomyces armeniacus]